MTEIERPKIASDKSLVDLATVAVQAQERLTFCLRHAGDQYSDVLEESNKTLDSMRLARSHLEGTAVSTHKMEPRAEYLQKLKQLVLMHVPSSLTDGVKEEMRQLTSQALQDNKVEIVSIALLTCPWYQHTQEERGQQAKHNSLVVVYQSSHRQVLAPLSLQDRDEAQVLDMGWFYAVEILHFASHLLKGKVRFVELLHLASPGVVWRCGRWAKLQELLDFSKVLKLKGFLEQCRGQAVGGVGRKSKKGQMKVKDGAVLYEFCESFRLLNHVNHSLNVDQMVSNRLTEGDLNKDAGEALRLLTAAYKSDDATGKTDLFKHVLEWRAQVDQKMKGVKWTSVDEIEGTLGLWLQYMRQGETWTPRTPTVGSEQTSKLLSLMEKIGGPIQKMAPQNIVMIAQAGSHLYDLATASSDVDFVVIYADPSEKVVRSCRRPQECTEDRGPTKKLEFGAYEARLFAEMMWKGSVVMVELVFADNLDYISESWQKLIAGRQKFVNEKTILQYLGLIGNNMNMIKSGKHKDTPREKKLFYQIFHKLYSLDFFMKGDPPPVRCSGETKNFIMKIRWGPLEGEELSRDVLYQRAKEKIKQIRWSLATREQRLPENVSEKFLMDWLMDVRGWADLPPLDKTR